MAIFFLIAAGAASPLRGAFAVEAKDLDLVPLPREVEIEPGRLPAGPSRLSFSEEDPLALREVSEALAEAGISFEVEKGSPTQGERRFLLRTGKGEPGLAEGPPDDPEGYSLRISPGGISLRSAAPAGLFYGTQTVRQLLLGLDAKDGEGTSIPCLRVRDWPSLRWRGFSDDLTRGPSTILPYLKREARLAAGAKLNFMTYYMEHQFAFRSHPEIGPPGGSLSAEELRELVEYGKGCRVEIVGNQQSFGHFYHILKHPRYEGLRETADIVRPAVPETYALLDDLYGEQMAALYSKFFNVCCDETWGLGTGPSKGLAEKEGVGRVYADHILALHRLVAGKHGRRMMMWGDIILQHPEELPRLPKDIVMLTWGYDARASFEDQIIPFARSGFEFFVCPGVSCWGRLIPDFATAEANIRNFVRDGIKHGALGVLNTTWDDSGENLNGWNVHGILWGAECAWSGASADPGSFDRRAGAVLFGERGGLLGKVVAAVKALSALPGTGGMGDQVFWEADPPRAVSSLPAERSEAGKHLALAQEAETAASGLVKAARRGGHEAESLLLAVRRIAHIARRRTALLDLGDPGVASERKVAALEGLRAECLALKDEYSRLWLAENRPYHLDVVKAKFDGLAERYRETAEAVRARGAGEFLIVEIGARAREGIADGKLASAGEWLDGARPFRTAIAVRAGGKARLDLPVEIIWKGESLGPAPSLFESPSKARVPVQRFLEGGKEVLAFVVPGEIPPEGERVLVAYHGEGSAPAAPPPGPSSGAPVEVAEEEGGLRVTNGPLRLLLKPEGAHIYRWEVRDLGFRDVTSPGETDWHGFLDTGGEGRSARYEIEVLAGGPVLAKFSARSPGAPAKTISVWRGVPWVEVFLDRAVGYFWNFDPPDLAGNGPTPGVSLFSSGARGDLGPSEGGAGSQRVRDGVTWSAKFRPGERAIALLTPEAPARHLVGPGGVWGGVGIEGSSPVLHLVSYGDRCPEDVKAVLERLSSTLTLLPGTEVRVGPAARRE